MNLKAKVRQTMKNIVAGSQEGKNRSNSFG